MAVADARVLLQVVCREGPAFCSSTLSTSKICLYATERKECYPQWNKEMDVSYSLYSGRWFGWVCTKNEHICALIVFCPTLFNTTVSPAEQIWMLKAASTRHLKCIGLSPVWTSSPTRERRPTSSSKNAMGAYQALKTFAFFTSCVWPHCLLWLAGLHCKAFCHHTLVDTAENDHTLHLAFDAIMSYHLSLSQLLIPPEDKDYLWWWDALSLMSFYWPGWHGKERDIPLQNTQHIKMNENHR